MYYETEDNDRNAKDNHFYNRKHLDFDHKIFNDIKDKSYKFIEENYNLIKDYEELNSNEDF